MLAAQRAVSGCEACSKRLGGIAMVGVAGSDNALTRPILFAVMAAMQKH